MEQPSKPTAEINFGGPHHKMGCRLCPIESETAYLLCPDHSPDRLHAVNAKLLKALEHTHTALDNMIGDSKLLETYLPLLLQDVSEAIEEARK